MAKDKSIESTGKGKKRTETSSTEIDVFVTRKNDGKEERKKRKITDIEESAQTIPEIPKEKKQKHKDKQSTGETRTKKKKHQKITEPPPPPAVVTPGQDEEGEELSPEDQRVLARKLKKLRKKEEKARLRAEGKTVAEVKPALPLASQQALDYLTCWAENRKEWKFQKLRQTWLLQQMFDSEKVPDESFSVMLSYIEGLRGAARDTTVEKAEALLKSLGDGPWDKNEKQKMHRAREVIQLLS